MMHGRNNGKKLMTVRIVKHAFEIIHLLTGENPVQVLVDAIINSGPREDSTRIGRAGTVRRQAVDVAPLRRVNQAIWLLCTGAREAAFRNIKTIAECLADELINASKVILTSFSHFSTSCHLCLHISFKGLALRKCLWLFSFYASVVCCSSCKWNFMSCKIEQVASSLLSYLKIILSLLGIIKFLCYQKER